MAASLACLALWSDEAPLATGPGQVQATRLMLCDGPYEQELRVEQRVCLELERKDGRETTCTEWQPVWRGRLRPAVEPLPAS